MKNFNDSAKNKFASGFLSAVILVCGFAFWIGYVVGGDYWTGVAGMIALLALFGVGWMIFALVLGVKGMRGEVKARNRR